jgi:hypothetical protein
MTQVLVSALFGALAAALVQPFTPTGWWLNSGRGVALTSIVLVLLAVGVRVSAGSWLRSRGATAAAALWVGANLGLAGMLFRAGPGTIFPIVIVMGAGISAAAVGAGFFLASLFSSGSRRA